MDFTSFGFHPSIMSGVEAAGYLTPTPIQAQAIPPVLRGRDVMGLAQTGTGKTAAFALPILQRLLTGPKRQVRALIVAPTRELAEQIHTAFGDYGRRTGLHSIAIYGGVGMSPQIEKLRQGVEIVVACPGRLLDHVGQRTINLSAVEVLVLDEADRMFDMGFLPDIRKIIKALPTKRQTLLFSATMPDDIRLLAQQVLQQPITVQVQHTAPLDTVTHALYPIEQHLKTELLLALLQQTGPGSVLIFTRTKHRAKRLGQRLEKAGYRASSIQGNLSQNRRQAALDGFRDGTYQVLVATDIAARGIDVTGISHVINYDMPDTADAYTHRIGRTGRAAMTGDAFTFFTREDTEMVRAIEHVLGEKVERRFLKDFDYKQQAPARDTEFARPPREPRRGSGRSKPATQRPAQQRPQRSSQHAPRTTQPSAPRSAPRPSGNAPASTSGGGGRPGSSTPSRPRSFGPGRRGR